MKLYTFHKGLRLDKPEWEMEPGEVPELTNFVFDDEHGLLRKRRGLSRVVSSLVGPDPVRGLARASVGGTNPHTLVVSGGILYRVQDMNPSWEVLRAGLADFTPVRFDVWKDRVFIANGADPLLSWDGQTVVEMTGTRQVEWPPGSGEYVTVKNGPGAGPRFVQQFADRLFAGGTPLFPDTLFYSRLLDPDTWTDPETGIDYLLDVSPGDNQQITGLVRTREQLTIFKSHSTYYLIGYDPEEWVLRRVSDSVGCVAPGSIVEMDGRTIWLSARGVYMDDGVHFYRIGAAIQPFVAKLTSQQQEKAVATTSGWHYILFFPDTPEGPVAFAYHVRFEAWVRWDLGEPIGAVCPKNLPTDTGGWIGGHAKSGIIYHGETGAGDDGKVITARLRLPSIGDAAPEIVTDLRRVAVDAEIAGADQGSVFWSVDGGQPVSRQLSGTPPHVFSTPVGTTGQRFTIGMEISGGGTGSFVRGIAADARAKWRRW